MRIVTRAGVLAAVSVVALLWVLGGLAAQAQVDATDIATKQTATVTVDNPPPGGGVSPPVPFTVPQAISRLPP